MLIRLNQHTTTALIIINHKGHSRIRFSRCYLITGLDISGHQRQRLCGWVVIDHIEAFTTRKVNQSRRCITDIAIGDLDRLLPYPAAVLLPSFYSLIDSLTLPYEPLCVRGLSLLLWANWPDVFCAVLSTCVRCPLWSLLEKRSAPDQKIALHQREQTK